MRCQKAEGHEVFLLWPGQMHLIIRKTQIRKRQDVDGIGSLEIIDPLPVPYDEGILIFDGTYTAVGPLSAYRRMLDQLKPDVIHLHTLMGLHEALLLAAKEKKIRVVFTAHDFFPICPKVTLFRDGKICSDVLSCESCTSCNRTALSLTAIRVLQSPFYRWLKDSAVMKKLRKRHRDDFLQEKDSTEEPASFGIEEHTADYLRLRTHFLRLLENTDIIHYNSSITKEVYESCFRHPNSVVSGITHGDIRDCRKRREYRDGRPLRIRYLGPQGSGKGFYLLKKVLDRLWKEQVDFRLDVHFTFPAPPPYMAMHSRYSYGELEQIFSDTDILVCPSIWYETFGYTVLEALSFGVPVLVSATVGAKDIIPDGAGIVVDPMDEAHLYRALKEITVEKLASMNRAILDLQEIKTMEMLSSEMMDKLYENRVTYSEL